MNTDTPTITCPQTHTPAINTQRLQHSAAKRIHWHTALPTGSSVISSRLSKEPAPVTKRPRQHACTSSQHDSPHTAHTKSALSITRPLSHDFLLAHVAGIHGSSQAISPASQLRHQCHSKHLHQAARVTVCMCCCCNRKQAQHNKSYKRACML